MDDENNANANPQEARYRLNLFLARMELACNTLDLKKTYAPNRFILIRESTLEEANKYADILPLTDYEALVTLLIMHDRIFQGCPIVSDAEFSNPVIFALLSDIIALDCSLSSLKHCNTLHGTVSTGFDIINVNFLSTDEGTDTVSNPHLCWTSLNLIDSGHSSFVDWDRFALSGGCDDFVDYKQSESDTGVARVIPIGEVIECKVCGALNLVITGLSPTVLQRIHENIPGGINHG